MVRMNGVTIMIDLQFLFQESIINQIELSPGYDDHASDVWLVITETEEVIVRSSRMVEAPNNDFWWGCQKLFGTDPRSVHGLEFINNTLCGFSTIPIPKVLRKGVKNSREYVVVEKLSGEVCHSFINQPFSILQCLGEGIAN